MNPATLLEKIKIWAQELGFQELGVADLDLSEHESHLTEWLAKGLNGEMGYMERNLAKRLHPELLLPGTFRIITARMNYLARDTRPKESLASAETAYISRYALGRDYHKLIRKRLAKLAARINAHMKESEQPQLVGECFRAFTDSAPILEKALAHKSGLGWIGKNTLVLNKEAGSWFFLGEIFTNIPLPVSQPKMEDACGACQACITVCPTKALIAPKKLDARRCISYLTIEHKGSIDPDLRPHFGNRIYGCDDCQLHCPWNRMPQSTQEEDFTPRSPLLNRPLAELFAWSEEEFLKYTEGSAIRRINYEQWQRNLAIAIGNGPAQPGVISQLQEKRKTATPLVAEHIDWALEQLEKKGSGPIKPSPPGRR